MANLLLYYELSACPLLLNSNKVYFASSLIAKPILHLLELEMALVATFEMRFALVCLPRKFFIKRLFTKQKLYKMTVVSKIG